MNGGDVSVVNDLKAAAPAMPPAIRMRDDGARMPAHVSRGSGGRELCRWAHSRRDFTDRQGVRTPANSPLCRSACACHWPIRRSNSTRMTKQKLATQAKAAIIPRIKVAPIASGLRHHRQAPAATKLTGWQVSDAKATRGGSRGRAHLVMTLSPRCFQTHTSS